MREVAYWRLGGMQGCMLEFSLRVGVQGLGFRVARLRMPLPGCAPGCVGFRVSLGRAPAAVASSHLSYSRTHLGFGVWGLEVTGLKLAHRREELRRTVQTTNPQNKKTTP